MKHSDVKIGNTEIHMSIGNLCKSEELRRQIQIIKVYDIPNLRA